MSFVVIDLHQKLIDVLTLLLADGVGNLDNLFMTSENSRLRTISILTDLYQRYNTTATIQRPIVSTPQQPFFKSANRNFVGTRLTKSCECLNCGTIENYLKPLTSQAGPPPQQHLISPIQYTSLSIQGKRKNSPLYITIIRLGKTVRVCSP
jgi:hypothetical protein